MVLPRHPPQIIHLLRHTRLTPQSTTLRSTCARCVHIKATPSTSAIEGFVDLSSQTQSIPKLSGAGPFPAEVQFEVLGAPYSLLSVSLPASAQLYSRRGTLVGLNGDTSNAVSTLSLLSPLTRFPFRIPFLYQRLTSSTPLTALIATNTPNTTFGVIELDGKVDWKLTQRDALLAWTGHSLTVRPSFLARGAGPHGWGQTQLCGRGLVAVVGRGQIYQATLQPGEEFLVHPGSLLAYSVDGGRMRPTPYRLSSSVLRMQIPRWQQWQPDLGIAKSESIKAVTESKAWRSVAAWVWTARMWTRRTVWGDRMFLQFQGPGTVLLQSRSARINDVISREDVSEFAVTQPGVQGTVSEAVKKPLTIKAAPTRKTPIMSEQEMEVRRRRMEKQIKLNPEGIQDSLDYMESRDRASEEIFARVAEAGRKKEAEAKAKAKAKAEKEVEEVLEVPKREPIKSKPGMLLKTASVGKSGVTFEDSDFKEFLKR